MSGSNMIDNDAGSHRLVTKYCNILDELFIMVSTWEFNMTFCDLFLSNLKMYVYFNVYRDW